MNALPTQPPSSSGPVPEVDVRDLMGGGRDVYIVLVGVRYILSITSKGKLILTK